MQHEKEQTEMDQLACLNADLLPNREPFGDVSTNHSHLNLFLILNRRRVNMSSICGDRRDSSIGIQNCPYYMVT